ncbi:alpha/beta fold hydrolase [Vibrio agarivorans]|uniref:alpha/beta fold hydrolase n=1 Tax=Vibrio agarivorans TaxID=153622 RepID=UPI002231DD43|nr:alpha/beta fold hydrolase [Vibrio agarivorans]MDN3661363.1 alpha/beta fold hydrolase [Vibrio agarivorans]
MDNRLYDGNEGHPIFIFAHGAGAGMDHDFMNEVAKQVAEHDLRVVRFNFPYMVKRAEDGKRRPPDRAPKLLEVFSEVIESLAPSKVVIGGKSMGGRMASLLAEHPNVVAVTCLGFPFHPPGKPEKFKGEHLATFQKPCLILQGERDAFGSRDEFEHFELSDSIQTSFIPDGDHSFKPRKRSGHTEAGNLSLAAGKVAQFVKEQLNAE